MANHFLSTDLADVDPADLPADWGRLREVWAAGDGLVGRAGAPDLRELRGRVMLCRRVDVLPVEIVVRGYLAGSGWRDYQRDGTVSGVRLPGGLREGDRLPEPILTPSTKAELGAHDEAIDFDRLAAIVGGSLAERLREVALRLYGHAAAHCETRGLLLADTKFEFGTWPDPTDLVLVDELLTPDSSRFWDAERWTPGGPPPSFDKQYVRDWLDGLGWDRTGPPPLLPREIVDGTRSRYVEAFERITGTSFDDYLEGDDIEP